MPYQYHVFLSHNSKDKPAVETVAKALQAKYDLKCWLDKWNLVPGEPWQEALEDALDDCETVAVFVGPHDISPWENEEMRSALEERVHDKTRRVIPVLLPGAPDNRDLKLPRFLTRLTWVDMRAGLDDEDALYRLYCGIQGLSPGPTTTPITNSPLPIGSYLPFPRNALFTGREADLQKLSALCDLRGSNIVISQAITGMGGIGKTQLAVEFAHRYGGCFRGVHWLDLREPDALDGAIALCGTKMGYFHTDQRELIATIMHTWISDGPRLLILDNFEEVAQSNAVLARFQHPSLRLLVTSRRKDFPKSTGLQVQQLGLFSETESLEFLEKTLEQAETSEARSALAEKLGYLPLALELAASYINVNGMDIAGYLDELEDILAHESMGEVWFEELDITTPTDHDRSLLATFQLSWQEVKDETAQKIFMLAGYCAPNDPIPREIFEKALEAGEKAVSKALFRLNALGLLTVSAGTPTIHPLVAAYGRTSDPGNEQLENVANTIFSLSNDANQSGLSINMQPYQLHTRACGEFAQAAKLEIAGSLWNEFGYSLREVADYAGAKAAYERALGIFEKHLGKDHSKVATPVNNLGRVLQALGDLDGAKAAFERALRILKKFLPDGHPNMKLVQENLEALSKKK